MTDDDRKTNTERLMIILAFIAIMYAIHEFTGCVDSIERGKWDRAMGRSK